MSRQLKARDKITQKMTRDGLVEVNETKETERRISRREQEADFTKPTDRAEPETQPGKRKNHTAADAGAAGTGSAAAGRGRAA